MGLFDFLKRRVESLSTWVAYGTGRNVAGPTEDLYNSALWSCVVNLSRLYATLPWHAYRKNGDGDRIQMETGLLPELLRRPNPYMTDYEFRFVMGFNFEMHGEAPALIQRSVRTGLPIALWPVSPSSLVVSEEEGRLYYTLAVTGTRYPASDILLIRNTPVGYGARNVLEPIYFARNDLDLENRCKEMQKTYYDGSSIVGYTISVPPGFTDEQKDKVRQMFSGKGYRHYVVDERIKLTPIQIQNADIAKLSEAQKWSATEVARRFNVPPFFIGDMTGTYNNAEQQGLQMVTYCLRPRIGAWEAALEAALCGSREFIRFSLGGLLRGDHATRAAFYHNGIMDGWLTVNEIRKMEDMKGIGDIGNKHFFPMNYGTLDDIVAGKYATGSGASLMSPWDLPAEKRHGKPSIEEAKSVLKNEKRRHDLAFVEKAQEPARTSRAKLERMIRAQLKASMDELRRLIATGSPTNQVLDDFAQWLDTNAAELQPQYKAVYLGVLKNMVPVVKDETGSDKDVPDDDMDAYAGSYADSMSKRVAGAMHKTASASVGTDTFDDDMDAFQRDYPVDQSEEEVNRSSNAFNVWLFAALGVSVYHVVAASNACEFCHAIDGKVASVQGFVLDKGSDVDLGDGSIRHIDKNYRHPPFHSHCRCSVAPGE